MVHRKKRTNECNGNIREPTGRNWAHAGAKSAHVWTKREQGCLCERVRYMCERKGRMSEQKGR